MDRELHRPYRSLLLGSLGALLIVSLTLKRELLGWHLLTRGERVKSTVLSIGPMEYRVRAADGAIVRVPKAGTLKEIFTGRQANVGDPLPFYWLAGDPRTARLVRFPVASTLLFLPSAAFLLCLPVAILVGRRNARRASVIARV